MSLVWVVEGSKRAGRPTSPLDPKTRAGKKLARLVGVESIADEFVVVNLVDRWKGRAAKKDAPKGLGRENAEHLLSTLPPEMDLVLVGKRVAAAFGIEGRMLSWSRFRQEESNRPTRRVAVIPHPQDGRWWADPSNAARAARFLKSLGQEA